MEDCYVTAAFVVSLRVSSPCHSEYVFIYIYIYISLKVINYVINLSEVTRNCQVTNNS